MSDNIHSFKHWIPNVLLKNWNQKYINPLIKQNDHLLIYDINKNDYLKNTYGKILFLSSTNKNIPFGEKYYNSEYLENSIFCDAERKYGIFINCLNKNENGNFVDFCIFWLFLLVRSKNSINRFKERFIKNISLSLNKHKADINQITIEYNHYEIGSKEISDIKNKQLFFKTKQDFFMFLFKENQENYMFFKDLYWNQSTKVFEDVNYYESIPNKLINKMINLRRGMFNYPEQLLELPDDYELSFVLENSKLKKINVADELLYPSEENILEKISLMFIPVDANRFMYLYDVEQIPNRDKLEELLIDYLKNTGVPKKVLNLYKKEEMIVEFYNLLSITCSQKYLILVNKESGESIHKFLTDIDFIKFRKYHKKKEYTKYKKSEIDYCKMNNRTNFGKSSSIILLDGCKIISHMEYRTNKIIKIGEKKYPKKPYLYLKKELLTSWIFREYKFT